MTFGQQESAPYVQGSWSITYKFVEMKGDKNFPNACRGPFPYQYTWSFDICMAESNNPDNFYQAQIAGSDPSTMRTQRIVEANPDEQVSRCAYRPTTFGPAGVTQDWLKLGEPGYPADNSWQNWRPRDEDDRQTEPRTFSDFQLPPNKPYVWGTLCHQYDWQDIARNEAGFKYYEGAWRHENETWIFLRNACDCKDSSGEPLAEVCGMEADGGCNVQLERTRIVQLSNEACLSQKGVDLASCPLSIIGVSGGPVLYTEAATNTPKMIDGRDAFCFTYSKITGTQLRNAQQVERNCRSTSQGESTSAEDGEDAQTSPASPRPAPALPRLLPGVMVALLSTLAAHAL